MDDSQLKRFSLATYIFSFKSISNKSKTCFEQTHHFFTKFDWLISTELLNVDKVQVLRLKQRNVVAPANAVVTTNVVTTANVRTANMEKIGHKCSNADKCYQPPANVAKRISQFL